jgi:hypothetical protein
MSNIIFNEKLIDKPNIKTKIITIKRVSTTTLGVRVWFVILATDQEIYQRWSMLMNKSDEILFLAKPGDRIEFKYIEDVAEDPTNQTFESFARNVILEVSDVVWVK